MLLDDLAALRPPHADELRLVVIAQIPRRLLGGVRVAPALERRVHFPLMVQQILRIKFLVVVLGGVGRPGPIF